jgi:integrase
VRINRKIVDGVSLHRASGRYYIIDPSGKRVYFDDWREARATYRAQTIRDMDDESRARMVAEAEIRRTAAYGKLKDLGWYDQVAANVRIEGGVVPGGDVALSRFVETANQLADLLDVPNIRIAEVVKEARAVPSEANPRLSEVGEAWVRGKSNEIGCEYVDPKTRAAMSRSVLTQHMRDVLANWQRFIDCLGNVRVGELQPETFRKFHEWADKEATKRATNRWHVQLMDSIKVVFNYTRRHYREWNWPPDIDQRIRAYTPKAYAPAEENAEPMPPDLFVRLLKRCDEWAGVDPHAIDASTQQGRGKRSQAIRKQGDGRQMRLILMLAVNCGLNAVDVQRLKWSQLKLDDRIPHLDLPRQKAKRAVGRAINRRTPLLPTVVDALREWQRLKPSTDGYVFRTARGTPIDPTRLGRTVGRLLDDEGLDRTFTLKHLRNVGPTLAANENAPEEMIQAFLGHSPSAMSNRYKGRKPVDYSKPIVDLIERDYFADLA